MNNDEKKQLAIELMRADEEDQVVAILDRYHLWEDDGQWLPIGGEDNPLTNSVTSNQMERSMNALADKIINSMDALLIKECWKRNTDPTSDTAPKKPIDARKNFLNMKDGLLSYLQPEEQEKLAENIWVVASGHKLTPSITIIDKGEGQEPDEFTNTFLSNANSNKTKIHFVQGKFGMGGTGVYEFCSEKYNLSLIVSRRSHELKDIKTDEWGVTVIRLFGAIEGVDKSDYYKYLTLDKKIISFSSPEGLDVIPSRFDTGKKQKNKEGKDDKLYDFKFDTLQSGTLIKLYDFKIDSRAAKNKKKNNSRGNRNTSYFQNWPCRWLRHLLPEVPYPFKACDLRHPANGIRIIYPNTHMLETYINDKTIEYSTGGDIEILDEQITYKYFLFTEEASKKDKAWEQTCVTLEPISWIYNGQAMAFDKPSFFGRSIVDLSDLSKSLIVHLDFSNVRKFSNFFKASRDRAPDNEYTDEVRTKLAEILGRDEELHKRKGDRSKRKLLEGLKKVAGFDDFFQQFINDNPELANFQDLFGDGNDIVDITKIELDDQGNIFPYKQYPTYFNLAKGNNYPEEKPRNAEKERKVNIKFDTDAVTNYFIREDDPGKFTLTLDGNEIKCDKQIANGAAFISFEIDSSYDVDRVYHLNFKVTDSTNIHQPFSGDFYMKVLQKVEKKQAEKKPRPKNIKKNIEFPKPIMVNRDRWDEFDMDKSSGTVIKKPNNIEVYVNMDNAYLLKAKKKDIGMSNVLDMQYSAAMCLISVCLYTRYQNEFDKKLEESIDDPVNEPTSEVKKITAHLSPVLLNVLSLGNEKVAAKMKKSSMNNQNEININEYERHTIDEELIDDEVFA